MTDHMTDEIREAIRRSMREDVGTDIGLSDDECDAIASAVLSTTERDRYDEESRMNAMTDTLLETVMLLVPPPRHVGSSGDPGRGRSTLSPFARI